MNTIRPSMMRLAGKKHHLVAVRRNIRLTYSSLPLTFEEWMEVLQSCLHSPTPHFHCSLSLFTFFCYHPSPPVDHLYFPSSQFNSVDIYLLWIALFVLELKYIYFEEKPICA